ncbi:SNF2 family N-terminal domain-containing protein [Cryptosporidium muris RN66]|uniref:SNF2 family N-terminal domain-containing protein n=1 Tax=Cryptosporidium muris (strain RN66) TaxID=441375 RepID=B6AGS7_CRYMR|nr:SNF2 family N-terminal domain-containing protein [Cryptosporidium muris RN66]EEA07418.1 SNF2 family N-terminal domain-containing protein [Cryptosporidium muris RN66]|eukprot:XP_002141767.1 SNF2 family N-terminal domain-containing protein [Cryptosporidium muris RN66]
MIKTWNKRKLIETHDYEGQDELVMEISLIRVPIMSMLNVDSGKPITLRPFKSPMSGHIPGSSVESQRMTLGCRIPRDSLYGNVLKIPNFKLSPKIGEDLPALSEHALIDRLILWEPKENDGTHKIEVDNILTKWLREHQRSGVKFMFECLMGLRAFEGHGCILADDMGLGKTLQSITILWTLLNQGFDGKPAVRKAVVVCPASLVKNWAYEIEKWLLGKCPCTAVAEKDREKVISMFAGFKYDRVSRVLIASYETFRMHASNLDGVPIDLIICDEAHRLKNDKTKTSIAINNLPAKKRLLLSGTPIQNDLIEFYSLVSLANPQALGDVSTFRKIYANPILEGREPDATEYQQDLAAQRLQELSNITNLFILRRANTLLAKVLPPKIILNIFCRLTPFQSYLYKKFLRSAACRKMLDTETSCGNSRPIGLTGQVLSSIQSLMKLCNHPSLIKPKSSGSYGRGFEGCEKYLEQAQSKSYTSGGFGSGVLSRRKVGNNRSAYESRPDISGKLYLLSRLLFQIRRSTDDRVVLVSNYTQTLDVFERLCRDLQVPCVRLDGSTSITKRHSMVKIFNDPNSNSFAFLLSSKAGGCGINLIGANRLVMFDPDWNPANDKQALARVWRDGQKKNCYIYRFFSTGTIEEKIYQRQLCKDGLSAMLVTTSGDNQLKDAISADLVRDLFVLREETISDTHEMIQCSRCYTNGQTNYMIPQLEELEEDNLNTWAHYHDVLQVPDEVLAETLAECHSEMEVKEKATVNPLDLPPGFQPVSFVMGCRVELQDVIQSGEEADKENKDGQNVNNLVVNVFGQKTQVKKKTELTDEYSEELDSESENFCSDEDMTEHDLLVENIDSDD